jgi:hypothetical protein
MCNKTNLIQKVPVPVKKNYHLINQPARPKNGKNRSVAEQFGSTFFVK